MGKEEDGGNEPSGKGEESWVDVSIEIPGMRDDDALPVFLAAMLKEALLADGKLADRLWINKHFHWRLYIDVRSKTPPQPIPKNPNNMAYHPSHKMTHPLLPKTLLHPSSQKTPHSPTTWHTLLPLRETPLHPIQKTPLHEGGMPCHSRRDARDRMPWFGGEGLSWHDR